MPAYQRLHESAHRRSRPTRLYEAKMDRLHNVSIRGNHLYPEPLVKDSLSSDKVFSVGCTERKIEAQRYASHGDLNPPNAANTASLRSLPYGEKHPVIW